METGELSQSDELVIEETPQDQFFKALVRGNSEYPQIDTGMNIYSGNALIPHMDGERFTWENFLNTDPSTQQLLDYRNRVEKIHKTYNIPVEVPSVEVLQEIYRDSKTNVYVTCLEIAKLTASELFPTLGSEKLSPENIKGLDTFFRDAQYKDQKAVLAELWRVSTEALTSPEGNSIAKNIRETWRGGAQGRDAVEVMAPVIENLQTLVRGHLAIQLPEIQEHVAFPIPPSVIETFVNNTIQS